MGSRQYYTALLPTVMRQKKRPREGRFKTTLLQAILLGCGTGVRAGRPLLAFLAFLFARRFLRRQRLSKKAAFEKQGRS